MKYDMIISGVGGQGILTIATVLARAALRADLRLKQSEVHGMAQRGGAVQSHLRMADGIIHSDMIPHATADMILAMEPMESLRYLRWLSPDGWIVSNSEPVKNIDDYPEVERLYAGIRKWPRSLLLDGSGLAREAGSMQALNMAMLGAASPFIPMGIDLFEGAIREQFVGKGGRVLEINLGAFRSAREAAEVRRRELEGPPGGEIRLGRA